MNNYCLIKQYTDKIEVQNSNIISYISETNNILDKSVYGHKNAKKSIERIIGKQMISRKNRRHKVKE